MSTDRLLPMPADRSDSTAVMVPSAKMPSVRPPAAGNGPARNATRAPFTPATPKWMCDATTLLMFATISW